QEVPGVKAAGRPLEETRSGPQIVGDRQRRCRANQGGGRVLAQPFEQHVAAQRKSDGVKLGLWLSPRQGPQQEVEVAGLARVIEPRTTVGQTSFDLRRIARA